MDNVVNVADSLLRMNLYYEANILSLIKAQFCKVFFNYY